MSYEFKSSDVYGIAQRLGTDTRKKGNELFFKWCPYCNGDGHDKETFSINLDNGTFKCFRDSCGKQGHLVQLARDFNYPLEFEDYSKKKHYRQLPQRPIQTKTKAIEFMAERGISKDITELYSITTQKENDNVLVFPFYDENNILQFVKYRKMNFNREKDKNKEWCQKDTMPILFGMNRVEGFDYLVITEGQIDSLSVAECGFKNAVSVPTGAKGFTWLDNCWDWISKFKEVTIFGDCEKGHITLVDELSRRLSCHIKVVQKKDYLGEKDANDILRKYGRQAVIDAVTNATAKAVSHVKKLSEVKSVDLASLPKINTGINTLDKVIGGLYFGQVVLLTGKRGEGKSTVMSQLIAEALNQNYKVFAYSGELPDYYFKRWLDFQIAGPQNVQILYDRFSQPVYTIADTTITSINHWYDSNAFIYDNDSVDGDSDEYEYLTDTIEQTIRQYGVRLVCIDNLMTAIDVDSSDNQYVQQSKFVRKLKHIAVRYDVVVILVAHPKKTQGQVDDNDSVSGSSDITNRVDTVLSYIKNSEEEPAGGKILVLKNRMTGKLATKEKAIGLGYDEKSKRIYSQLGNLDYSYGWERKTPESSNDISDLPF